MLPPLLQFVYHLVNPGGEELSLAYIPMKDLTAVFIGFWNFVVLVMILWAAIEAWRWRKLRESYSAALSHTLGEQVDVIPPVRSLHGWLTFTALVFVVNSAVVRYYFLDASSTGTFDLITALAANAVSTIATSLMFGIMLYLSRGWQVTRMHLEPQEARLASLLVLLYAFVNLGWQWIGTIFFLFILVLMYVVMLRYMFSQVTWRLTMLHGFRSYVSNLFGRQHEQANSAFEENTVYIAAPADESRSLIGPRAEQSTATDVSPSQPAVPTQSQNAYGTHSDNALHEARAASVQQQQQQPASGFWGMLQRGRHAFMGDPNLLPDGSLTLRQLQTFKHFRITVVAYVSTAVLVSVHFLESSSCR